MIKLDWKKIEKSFNTWHENRQNKCKKCGNWMNYPDWEEQWAYIKRRVNSEIKKQQGS